MYDLTVTSWTERALSSSAKSALGHPANIPLTEITAEWLARRMSPPSENEQPYEMNGKTIFLSRLPPEILPSQKAVWLAEQLRNIHTRD
ncbi:hypothetical protein JK217_09090 [Gluconobacter kondonii]|nr:hypothetical protein [Gluconobacter kondonii]